MPEQTLWFTGHFDRTHKQETRKKNIYTALLKFQGEKHPFLLYVLACWGRMFMLLSRFLTL